MSIEDRNRWEKKYASNFIPTGNVEVVEKYAKLAKGEMALDLACGMGRNSRVLLKQGFKVEALDISPTAIASLQKIENLDAKEVDFDTYVLEENRYDLIVCTYFLKRELFPQIEKALKKEGLFIFETFMHHSDNTKVPSQKSYLLEKDELKTTFSKKFEILHLREFMAQDRCGEYIMKASMVARVL